MTLLLYHEKQRMQRKHMIKAAKAGAEKEVAAT
jgi:hypothetical protein